MRDHVFQLLSPAFFGRWKGRHQVRYEVGPAGGAGGPPAAGASAPLWGPGRAATLAFPPPYSVCAQRVAGSGAWLFPAADPPVAGQWLCAVPAAVRAAPEEEGGGETKSK